MDKTTIRNARIGVKDNDEMAQYQTNYGSADCAAPSPYNVPPVDTYCTTQKDALQQMKAKQHAVLEKSSEGMNLCNEANEVRVLVDISRDLAIRLRDFLFDAVPECGEVQGISTAQVPTLEGHIRSSKYMLKDHVRELEQIIAKIGGR